MRNSKLRLIHEQGAVNGQARKSIWKTVGPIFVDSDEDVACDQPIGPDSTQFQNLDNIVIKPGVGTDIFSTSIPSG